jgi:hypothetical protein
MRYEQCKRSKSPQQVDYVLREARGKANRRDHPQDTEYPLTCRPACLSGKSYRHLLSSPSLNYVGLDVGVELHPAPVVLNRPDPGGARFYGALVESNRSCAGWPRF